MKHLALFSLLFAAMLAGCSHSTTPPTAPSKTDSSTLRRYPLTGEVARIDVEDSHFDTVFWYPASLDTVTLTGAKAESVTTGLSGSYFFDSLPAGNYTISVSMPGFATTSLRANVPLDTASTNEIHLFPISWLQVMIDSVYSDPDPSQGLDIRTRITSTDPTKPAIGSVYLFIDTARGIDPAVASSYDIEYILEFGNEKDSTIYENIQPQLVHAIYPAGTHVFCTAYASPYAAQFTYASRDSFNKPIYPFFGMHPGNTVEFRIP